MNSIRFLLIGVILFGSFGSPAAMTWNFDTDGDAQGWYARESVAGGMGGTGLLPLESDVRDGVWRIRPRSYEQGVSPAALLVSPEIDQDSRLFDRVTLRLRLVHDRLVVGRVLMAWTNQHNRLTPGMDPDYDRHTGLDRFLFVPPSPSVTYTTGWQEVVLQGFAAAPALVWADTLLDIRLDLLLAEVTAWSQGVSGPEAVPEALEIDWIRLTGVEEQLQGELPPPRPARLVPGLLFGPADFQGMGFQDVVRPVLGDLDEDGDLDLVLSSEHDVVGQSYREKTWTVAYNDGTGHFRRGTWTRSATDMGTPNGMAVYDAADLDGDGYVDLVLAAGTHIEVWLNNREGGFVQGPPLSGFFRTLADVDQDGDLDLCTGYDLLQVFLNDGRGGFTTATSLAMDVPTTVKDAWWDVFAVGDFDRHGQNQILWSQVPAKPLEDPALFTLTSATLARGLEWRQPFAIALNISKVLYVGDADNDGNVDLGTTEAIRRENTGENLSFGLLALLNRGDGSFDQKVWLPQGALLRNPYDPSLHLRSQTLRTWEFDGDGVPDQVFLDANPAGRNAVVLLGRKSAMPVLEGQYALPGKIGVEDAGDIDGDADTDLVVGTSYGGGGICVLRNLRAERNTAVTERVPAAAPASFHLGANYPNPFNPSTVIPFSLPQASLVRVEVYDLLGQRVRELVAGVLEPGAHRVEWDGRDEKAQEAASGVYVYRVDAAGQILSGKMAKAE